MKIVIPVIDHQDKKYQIANGFNTSDTVCIYDKDKDSFTWHASDEITPRGVDLVTSFSKHALDAIITATMKPMALNFFMENDIKVYKANNVDLRATIQQFNGEGLVLLNLDDTFATASICSGNCKSCATDKESSTCKPKE